METEQETPKRPKWPATMALICLVLFAIFWSLDAFFFWTLLLLSSYFGFLHFYYSDSIQKSFDGIFSSFRRNPQPPPNPYQTFSPQSETPNPATPQAKSRNTVKLILLGFVLVLFFRFLFGLFSAVEESAGTEETISTSESLEDESGTTYWNEKGNAAIQNEKQDSALYYYDKALAIDPQNTYALYNKGLTYVLRQDYRTGNTFTRRCLNHHPDYNPAWWLLGYSYDITSQTDSALYCLEQAYRQDYNQPDFLQLLAEVYVKKDKRASALEVYQRMVALDTTRADIFRKMAELDPSNGEKYMQKVRALGN